MAAYFNIFLIVMALLALAVYIALHYFEAGYGYLFNRKYGFPIPNRIGWVLMECPVFIAMTVLWLLSDRTWEAAPLALLILFHAAGIASILLILFAVYRMQDGPLRELIIWTETVYVTVAPFSHALEVSAGSCLRDAPAGSQLRVADQRTACTVAEVDHRPNV